MKTFLALVLCGSIIIVSACHYSNSEPPALTQQYFKFAGSNRCDTSKNTGVDVSVAYVLLKDNSTGAQKINDSLRRLAVNSIVGWLDEESVTKHPDVQMDIAKAAALFATDYEVVRKDMGGLSGCWEVQTRADTLHASPRALAVKFETFSYTGGAHPNSNVSFYTFDRKTGELLSLSDLVADTTALLRLVEKEFRKQQAIAPNHNLEQEGYFLRDGQFFLPANIGMGSKGMLFYYNPYEIAAYAVGPIQVTVPYDQLGGILRRVWL